MGLFDQRAGGGSRRYFKLLKQRCKAFGVYAFVAALVCVGGALLWKNGSFARLGSAAAEKTVAFTADMGFRVSDILVTGRSHVSQDEILDHLGIRAGAPVFSVNLAEARKNLLGVPWVKEAQLSRRLPGAIVVAITERAPVALWQYNKKISVIDADGAALTTDDLSAYGDLPLVVGEDAPKNAAALFELLKSEPVIAAQFASAVRIGARRWDLHLKNGMVVMLPAEDEGLALARLAHAADLLSKNIARIDLRLPNRLVVAPGTPVTDKKENI